MIKKFLIQTINFYQIFISTSFKNIFGMITICRLDVTCSEYAKQEIIKNGALKGSINGFKRFLKCQPFYTLQTTNHTGGKVV